LWFEYLGKSLHSGLRIRVRQKDGEKEESNIMSRSGNYRSNIVCLESLWVLNIDLETYFKILSPMA
jgi:hypothetical protein